MSEKVLGVDIGGVIKSGSFPGGEVPRSFESIKELKENGFFTKIFVVSRCFYSLRTDLLHWLEEHCFWERSGLTPDDIHFCCLTYQKKEISQKLGLTHFLDDRLNVLGSLKGVVRERFFFHQIYMLNLPDGIRQVFSWADFLRLLRAETALGSE